MSRFVKSAFLALAAAMTAAGLPAAAGPLNVPYSVKIFHGDLNLDSEAGAVTAMARIDRAASKACGDRPAPMQLRMVKRHSACVADVKARAVAAINAPVLTALHTRTTAIVIASR